MRAMRLRSQVCSFSKGRHLTEPLQWLAQRLVIGPHQLAVVRGNPERIEPIEHVIVVQLAPIDEHSRQIDAIGNLPAVFRLIR